MPVQADFTISAENFQRIDMNQLTEMTTMKRFKTPHRFFEHTLIVFQNGLRVEKDNEDGWIIIDDETFELKENYPNNYRISCIYVKKD